jgi:aminoglycoside phosphotransferase family enzyme/CheY-like chemotaxis protein
MSRTVLVVDDEPDLVVNCERLLQREGHSCLHAHAGPDAIRLIGGERPDLVVTDLRLPGAGGLTVARHARSRVPPIPDHGLRLPAGEERRPGERCGHLPRQALLECGIPRRRPASPGPGAVQPGWVTAPARGRETVSKEEPGRSLLDDLGRPEAYPEPRPSRVTQVTTHISWVFLTDREVWKLKRPVDYGFVDYTTLERRRRCCEDEVRLNRRLAPDVYLGVVPVRLGPQGHGFGPDGDIVEEALLRRGALTRDHLTRLAARLARFFADAAPAPKAGAFGAIRENVTENAQVEPFVGRFVSRETFDAVRSWQLGVLRRDPGRFRARVEQGRTRDGHGDLRLEHVSFEDTDPLAIDCVEFNERLRSGDVAADVAFLAMELTARARADLAELFLARFALKSDDYDLYGVVDFYAGYRAWVRGKVAAFLAADPSTPQEKAVRKAEEARTLFALARSHAGARSGKPPVIAVGGVIGSGKSTLAEALGQAVGMPVISSDRTRKALAGCAPPSERRTAYTAPPSLRGPSTSCSAGPP